MKLSLKLKLRDLNGRFKSLGMKLSLELQLRDRNSYCADLLRESSRKLGEKKIKKGFLACISHLAPKPTTVSCAVGYTGLLELNGELA
jgi:hypothetical protein